MTFDEFSDWSIGTTGALIANLFTEVLPDTDMYFPVSMTIDAVAQIGVLSIISRPSSFPSLPITPCVRITKDGLGNFTSGTLVSLKAFSCTYFTA